MNTAELKSELHKLIVETEDTSVLQRLRAYIYSLKNSTTGEDWWNGLPKEVQNDLKISLQQEADGETSTHEDVTKDLRKRFPHLNI